MAGALQRPEATLVYAEAELAGGGHLSEPPVFRLAPAASPEELGDAVQGALAAYRTAVPRPDHGEWGEAGKPFLKAAGFRSWRSLHRDAKMSWITQNPDGSYVFTILKNGGSRGDRKGFQPFGVPDQKLRADASTAELGLALLGALDLCE